MKRFAHNVTRLLRSRRFFKGTMLFFVVESLWIAFSANYPQAFDEQFHFGLIQFYAHHWLPFLSSQPADTFKFGAIVHDPSYLYHYLMSFPYRLIALVVHNQAAQVIILRIVDIALFSFGLVWFRRVLLRARMSPAFTNASILIVALIPIVPQLAAQVNYDDLLFPLSALACWLTFDVYESLKARRVDVRKALLLLSLCLLASLVKYAFLPIFVAIVLFLSVVAFRSFGHSARAFGQACALGFRRLSTAPRVGLAALVLVSVGLFSQRYAVNVVKYHNPIPDCGQVLTVQDCLNYGPWHRNYDDKTSKATNATKNPVRYTGEWFYGLYYRLFFAINGNYTNYVPLPLPSIAAIVLAFAGLFAVVAERRALFGGNAFLVFFVVVAVCYCGALWLDNYKDFLKIGQPVAINGRYLLPILLPIGAVVGRAFSLALRRWRRTAKPLIALAVLLLFVEGGGVLTFISRSDDSWYWPNPVVVHANHAAHKVLAPVLIEKGGKYY